MLNKVAKSWVWGHASVGPYSLVFWQIVDNAGNLVNNLYLTSGKKILELGEEKLTLSPDGSIAISLGSYHFKGVPNLKLMNAPGYDRWLGKFTGGLVGGVGEAGPAMWEQLVLHV